MKIENTDKKFMEEAIKEARKAYRKNEVPIGAVIVQDGKVISRGYNEVERRCNATAHAEILAIARAVKKTGGWRLNGCSLYVTVEPCLMCLGAILLSRISRIVYGASQPQFGSINKIKKLPKRIEIIGGVLKEKSRKLLQDFFRKHRR